MKNENRIVTSVSGDANGFGAHSPDFENLRAMASSAMWVAYRTLAYQPHRATGHN